MASSTVLVRYFQHFGFSQKIVCKLFSLQKNFMMTLGCEMVYDIVRIRIKFFFFLLYLMLDTILGDFFLDSGLPKEKNVGIPTQVSSMIESKVEDLENMEVPSDAIMGLSVTMPSSGFMQKSTEAATTAVAQFETPPRPLKKLVAFT